jgi:hypothetical protein
VWWLSEVKLFGATVAQVCWITSNGFRWWAVSAARGRWRRPLAAQGRPQRECKAAERERGPHGAAKTRPASWMVAVQPPRQG